MSGAVKVEAPGALPSSRPLAWWGTLVALGAATTMLTTLGFAHVYLGAVDRVRPALGLPALALLVLLVSSAATAFARARARTGAGAAGAVPALAGAAALGAGFLVLQQSAYSGMSLDVRTDVGEASFAVTAAFHHVLAAVGLVALLVAAAKRAQSPDSVRSRDAVLVAALVWQTAVLSWLPLFVLLYLAPRVT